MTATPADIATLTSNGVTVRTSQATGNAIKALYPNAQPDVGPDGDLPEIETFWNTPAQAQILLDERWGYQKVSAPPHVGVEIQESAGIGSTVPVTPKVPSMRAIDDGVALDQTLRLRSYAQDTGRDRYSLELLK